MLLVANYCVQAEMHTWTSISGKTLEGEYVRSALDKVVIKTSNGEEVRLPIDQLCREDQNYLELMNPPEISIDYRESTQPKEFVADPWYDRNGGAHDNHPVYFVDASFGALIKQKNPSPYNHDLKIEMYILTKQYLDPDKYHLIARVESEPFRLTEENGYRYIFDTPQTYRIIYYNLYSELKRGEKASKYLILVRDERGEIIDYRARSEWLYKYLDRLEKLPVGAWINDKCIRVYPTSPPRYRRDGF